MKIDLKENARVLPESNTIWKAEELNQLSQELQNILIEYGITPDAANVTQLLTALKEKFYRDAFKVRTLITGITPNVMTQSTITINGSGQLVINQPITIIYNDATGARGIASYSAQVLQGQTINAPAQSTGVNAVVYIYAVRDNVNQATPTIEVSTTKYITADYCLLGSAFVLNDNGWKFQAESFAATPFLSWSSAKDREAAEALTAGGLIIGKNDGTMKLNDITLDYEGIGVGTERQNFITFIAQDPLSYKFIYKTYGNSEPTQTVLQTDKFFNTTTQALDSLPVDTFNIFIPCITPTGQFLLRPKEAATVQGYGTMEDAMSDIINSTFSEGGYDKRLIYLGFSIVVKVGATDFTNPDNFKIVAIMPNELAAFGNLAGTGVPTSIPDFSNAGKGIIRGKAEDGYLAESGDGDASGKIQGWEKTVKTSSGIEEGIAYTRFGVNVVLCENESDANALLQIHPDWIVGF